jgi:hypothetical protein
MLQIVKSPFLPFVFSADQQLIYLLQDIMISGAPNSEKINHFAKRANENHLANGLHYSLRVSVTRVNIPV